MSHTSNPTSDANPSTASTPATATGRLTFRSHTEVPEDLSGIASSHLLIQLVTEWVHINTAPATTVAMRRWAKSEPTLRGYQSPGELVDAIDVGNPETTDELLLALLRLSQAGHNLAGRVLLQAMLPKLVRINSSSWITREIHVAEDKRQATLTAFLEVVHAYPVNRRVHGVAGSLALDTLHAITADKRRPEEQLDPHLRALWTDPADLDWCAHNQSPRALDLDELALDDRLAEVDDLLPSDPDLIELLAWATHHGTITLDDAHLLLCVYKPDAAAALPRGQHLIDDLSPTAIRKRRSRARKRLIDAVRSDAGATSRTSSVEVAHAS